MDKQAENWSKSNLNKVSRTFALSLSFLPDSHEQQMTIAYLLCRVPDTIEDSTQLQPTEKTDLLNQYTTVLSGTNSPTDFVTNVQSYDVEFNSPDWKLVSETDKLIAIYNDFPALEQQKIADRVTELTNGMAKFVSKNPTQTGVRIESIDQLDEYCYFVAGVVGHLIVDLLSIQYNLDSSTEQYLRSHGEQYGLLLQYINILKDVYDDYKQESNIYIPQSITSEHGVTQEEFVTTNAKTSPIIKELISYAESYFESSTKFVQLLQEEYPEVYLGWSIPHYLAVATMRELKSNTELATRPEEVKISRTEVQSIVSTVQRENALVSELNDDILSGNTK